MNDRDFIYWLHGYFEITQFIPSNLYDYQVIIILEHINLVRKTRTNITDLSLPIEWIAGKLSNYSLLSNEAQMTVYKEIKDKLLNSMTKVIDLEKIKIETEPYSAGSVELPNPCLKEIMYRPGGISANPTGAGIMSC